MSIERRLTAIVTLAIVGTIGLCSRTHAGQFAFRAYSPGGTLITPASDISVTGVYKNTSGASVTQTSTSTTYPISFATVNLSTTEPGVKFTVTKISTSQSVTLTLHGNIATPNPMPVHVIIPAPTIHVHVVSYAFPTTSTCYTEAYAPCYSVSYCTSSCQPVRWARRGRCR